MKKLTKKGQVMDQLGALGIGIAILTVTMVVVFLILAELGSNATVTADSNASAAVDELTNATATIPDWVPIVVITFIGALLLGMVALFRRSA